MSGPQGAQGNSGPQYHHRHGPPAGIIPVPGGPQEYETVDGRLVDNDTYGQYPVDKDERAIFAYLLHPADSYTPEGIYWADLPWAERAKFNAKVESQEAKRELGELWKMIKRDPLSPIGWYFRNAVLPGAGLLLEGYVLFSIGNISALFQNVWPECWSKYTVCDKQWTYAVTYMEIVGIMVGQVLVGLIGDGIGRRWGLIQDAVIMFIGLLMLTAMWGPTLNGWVICYAWSLFFYSIGVGGEYPMTATSGMEKSNFNKVSSSADRLHRGRKVTMAFLMQGWGQFFNQALLILLLIIFHHGQGYPDQKTFKYSKVAVQWTFRISFAIPAIGTLWLAYFRAYKMPNVSVVLDEQKKKAKVTGYDWKSLRLTISFFGMRLFATCAAWFCNDVFFYGNKLFQSAFIKTITNDSKKYGVMLGWLYNMINIGCSMAGYYLACFTIDTRFYGRNWMMQVGFLMCFVLFVVPGFHLDYYQSKGHIKEFQVMYFLSSFFNQFGPNAVTFLVAAEVFPTNVRASAHGFSAAWGKAGALLASVVYNYMPKAQTKFHFVPWFGLAGMLATFLFLPDVTGLDLRELDRWWQYVVQGRAHEYHGVAINPRHLSLWERFRGVGKNYNPELDYKQRVEAMRADWENKQRSKIEDLPNAGGDDDFNNEVHNYFVRTSPMISPDIKEKAGGNADVLELPSAHSDISDASK